MSLMVITAIVSAAGGLAAFKPLAALIAKLKARFKSTAAKL